MQDLISRRPAMYSRAMADIIEYTPSSAMEVGRRLGRGEVGIIPCDTIYGLVGAAPETESKLIELKKRREKRFLRLIPDADISPYSPDVLPERVKAFWPAPLTVIVRDFDGGTVALRCPDDPRLQKILNAVGRPLFSTSVNISGEPPLNSFDEIAAVFGASVDLIVDGGDLKKKAPSTVVDLTRGEPLILREGAVGAKTVLSLFD